METAVRGLSVMTIVFAAALAALVTWIGWLRRRTRSPVWAIAVALLTVGLAAWCVFEMAEALIAEYQVPRTLRASDQERQVAMYSTQMMRWGMRFWAAGLSSAGWMLFAMWRWEAPADAQGT